MNPRTRPFAYLVLLLLTGCASLGIAPADSFNQKLAYDYGVHTAVLQAATQAVQTGYLSSTEATQILSMADNAKALLDGAMSLSVSGDTTGATNKLALASAALTALQTFLHSRSK